LNVLFERTYRAGTLGHTFICDGGELGNLTVPASFTDRGPAPEVLTLTVGALAELAYVVGSFRDQLDRIEPDG
jgi:hypothetical protein